MYNMKALTERNSDSSNVAFRFSDEGLITFIGKRRERNVYDIDLNRLSILRHIPQIDHEVDSSNALTLGYLSYLYTLRLSNTKMMRRLTTVHKDVVTQTKDNIFMSKDIVKYKIATIRCVVENLTPANAYKVEKHFKQCGLTSDDAIFYYLLYYNNDLKDFVDLVSTITDIKFTLDVNVLSDEIYANPKVNAEFNKQSGYFAYRKLKFIADGNRFEPKDMQQTLLERGVQAYYWVRPFYSVDHAVNYAKRSMHGYMSVLIDYYNSDERRRTTEDCGYGSDNTVRSLDDNEGFVNYYNSQEEAMILYMDTKYNSEPVLTL